MPTSATFRSLELSAKHLSALRREAKFEGVTPAQYVKHLIEERLDVAERARSKSLRELAEPIRDALKDLSEAEIDALVEKARGPRRASRARRPGAAGAKRRARP